MKIEEKLAVAAVILSSAAVFFAAALSAAENILKAVVILSDLVFSGLLLQKLLKCEGWYGILLVRGEKGLGLMKRLGNKHPRAARELTEFGLSFAFGIPFSLYAQARSNWGKVAVHALLLAGFYWWLQGMPAASSWLNSYALAVGLLAGVAAIGLIAIASSAASIFTTKTAVSSVAPVVPGITLPFWEGLLAIIIVAIVHEVAHGVLAAAEKLQVKSSGILLFGFLPIGAFVEPDEEKFKKIALWKKRRILIAGSASNFYFFLLFISLTFAALAGQASVIEGVAVSEVASNSSAFGLLAAGQTINSIGGRELLTTNDFYEAIRVAPEPNLVVDGQGKKIPLVTISVTQVVAGSPAEGVLREGEIISFFEGERVYSTREIQKAIELKKPGDVVRITSGGVEKKIVLGPDKKMGIILSQSLAFSVENKPKPGRELLLAIISFIVSAFAITAFLNFALSVVNLLPIFVTDGHRMVFEEIAGVMPGKEGEKKAARITNLLGIIVLALLLVNLGRWFKFI